MTLKSKSECKQTQITLKVENKHYIWCAEFKQYVFVTKMLDTWKWISEKKTNSFTAFNIIVDKKKACRNDQGQSIIVLSLSYQPGYWPLLTLKNRIHSWLKHCKCIIYVVCDIFYPKFKQSRFALYYNILYRVIIFIQKMYTVSLFLFTKHNVLSFFLSSFTSSRWK